MQNVVGLDSLLLSRRRFTLGAALAAAGLAAPRFVSARGSPSGFRASTSLLRPTASRASRTP